MVPTGIFYLNTLAGRIREKQGRNL